YTLTYLAHPADTATITIDPLTGAETIADNGAINHLAQGQELDITVNYTVADSHGATAPQSNEIIKITGQNDAPTDGNEIYSFNEDTLVGTTTNVTPTKLANASDPDGDTLHISSFGSASTNFPGEFSIVQT